MEEETNIHVLGVIIAQQFRLNTGLEEFGKITKLLSQRNSNNFMTSLLMYRLILRRLPVNRGKK